MKKSRNAWKIIFSRGLFLALLSVFFFSSLSVYAGTLTDIKDRLSRQMQNLTSGVIHTFVFTTELAVSGGAGNNQVRIELPVADDGLWCRTAGTLTASGCTEDGALALPGTLSAACTQTNDTITVTGVNNLLATTAYCVQIDDTGTGDLGTPSTSTTGVINFYTNNGDDDVDSAEFAVDIVTDDQITVTAQVGALGGGGGGGGGAPPPTEAIFTGKSYPNSPVTLLKNAQFAAVTTTDANGDFQIKLTDLTAGTYVFSLYAVDADGRTSPLLSFSTIIYQNTTTYAGGIFIGPTIDVDKSQVEQGETIAVFGYSVPSADILIFINGQGHQFSAYTVSDDSGKYQYNIDTSSLGLGEATISIKAYYQNILFGALSKLIKFIVGEESVLREREAERPEKGDFNNDGKVDLVDLSVMIFWLEKPSPPSKIDLKPDGVIDIKDFSVLMYYWTG